MTTPDPFFSHFGVTDADAEAIFDRAKAGTLTAVDHATVTRAVNALSEELPQIVAAFGEMWPFGLLVDILDIVPLVNQALAEYGFDVRLAPRPTYRTEPRPDVELGGKPRNPEADILDAIDELVDWQMSERRPVDVIAHVCRVCLATWTGDATTCPECEVIQ